MSNCNQDKTPQPDLTNAIKPEKNIPERIAQKNDVDYITPHNRDSKSYRPIGSFSQREGKNDAEPELPHTRPSRNNLYLGNILDSETKSFIDINSVNNKENKSSDELIINNIESKKNGLEIDQNQQLTTKLNNDININSIPTIKIGDTIFVNSTRQYKNSSIDIINKRESKQDYNIPSNNTRISKDFNTTDVDSDNRFIKTDKNVPVHGPERNGKTSEKNIDVNTAFINPKDYKDLNVFTNLINKKENDLDIKNESQVKEEVHFSTTNALHKKEVDVNNPPEAELKSEYKIDDVISSSKKNKEIANPTDGEEKNSPYIDDVNRINNKELNDIDEIIQQNQKGLQEIDSNDLQIQKERLEIEEINSQNEKELFEIDENNNRISKPNINNIDYIASSSINKEYSTLIESETLQKTNLNYDIKTPEHQIIENNYDTTSSLRNKDVADDIPTNNSPFDMFNKNLSDDIKSSQRIIKDSINNITAESFSGFNQNTTNEEIIAIISNNNKTEYDLNVLNQDFISKNNYNLNFNYYNDDFNSIVSNINFEAEMSINAGKLIPSTPRKTSINAVSSIGAISPLDQEDNRWDYQSIIENNSEEKAKASGEAITANSYVSINTSSHNLINQEIYSNTIIDIDSSAIQVNNNIANIKNKNYIYNDYSSPRNVSINYIQQGYDLTTPRKIAAGGERILNTQNITSQSQIRADYTDNIITGTRTNLKLETNFRVINAAGFDSTNDTITITDISLNPYITNISQQITSRIDYTHFSTRIEDIKLDSNTGLPINWTNYESGIAIYNDIRDDDIIDRLVVTSVIDHLTAQPVGQENHNFIYNITSFGNRSIPDDIIYKGDNPLTATVETTHTRQTLGGTSLKASINSSIVNTIDDTFWSEVKIGDDGEPERDANGNLVMVLHSNYNGEARQILNSDGNVIGFSYYNQEDQNFSYSFSDINNNLSKAKYNTNIVNTVDDKFWTEISYDEAGNEKKEIHTNYNGKSKQILNDNNDVIGYSYYDQEDQNFSYSFYKKEGNIASKNSIISNYSPSDTFSGNKEFGLNNYEFPTGNFFLPFSSDYIEGETLSVGLSSSRDIETANSDFNPWWQMLLNIGSITGVNNAINDVSGIISNVAQLFNGNFYKQFIGTSFSLNNDFGNTMRRFATVDIPVVAGSFLRSYNMMGGQDTLAESLNAIDGIKDLVSTSASVMNQPGAFLANLLRGQSGVIDVFTGGGTSMINIATQGSTGKFGGLAQSFSNNLNESNDISDSFAVRGSQWKTTSGQTIFNRATTDLGQPYNKDFIVDQIFGNKSINEILDRKELAKETLLTEYAAYKTFISGYEGIRELANEDISTSQKKYPTKEEAWDINKPRTQTNRQKSATAKPITGWAKPFDLWKATNVNANLSIKEEKDSAASEGFVSNPEPLIHNKQSNETFYDHIIVSSNGQNTFTGDSEWKLLTTDKNDNIWKQISSIPHANLKYNSDIIFQAENRVKQEFHSIGIENKLNPEQVRSLDPHDIEVRFNPRLNPEEQTTTKSIFLSIANDNNNYGGGKRAFIEKNKDNMLILLDEKQSQPQQMSRNNAPAQSLA